jgi:hypothetical protein
MLKGIQVVANKPQITLNSLSWFCFSQNLLVMKGDKQTFIMAKSMNDLYIFDKNINLLFSLSKFLWFLEVVKIRQVDVDLRDLLLVRDEYRDEVVDPDL